MRPLNLRWRLACIVAGLGVLGILGSSLILLPHSIKVAEADRLLSFKAFLADFQETVLHDEYADGGRDEQLVKIFCSRSFREDAEALLLVRNRQVAVSSRPREIGKDVAASLDAKVRADILKAMDGAIPGQPMFFSEERSVWAFVRLPVPKPEFLLAKTDLSAVRSLAVRTVRQDILWQSVVLMCALIAVDLFFARKVLEKLSAVNAKVESSDAASLKLPEANRPDEVGTLARALQQFAGRAAAAERSHKALLAELESRIVDRTAQLDVARREAESANQAKSAFLAAMSHEIRTPMNSVLNMVGTVLETPVEPEAREYLKVADSSARHLLSVINDILDFSKIESDNLDIEDIPFSMHALLEGVGDLFRAKVAETKVELVLDIAPGTPDGMRGDPTRLRQVLVNLVGNAFKFTQAGQIVLRAEAAGNKLTISVADSGIGISPEKQARLFHPFVQADAATTRRFGGTGLGLAISQRLARLMGGDISLFSVLGEGSTFTVELPLKPEPAGSRRELRLPMAIEGRSVLLIEDNNASREVTRVMLEQHGLACVAFPAVEPALNWLTLPAASGLGAALVDWQLAPGSMDGLTGIQELRQTRPGLPCFLISAFADHDLQEKARAMGAAAFISKPLTWAGVHAALQLASGGHGKALPELPATPAVEPFAGTLALLAEDNPQNQLVAKVMLKKLGIAVELAENGRIALEMAQANPGKYQVILMDVQMPEMDGLEATQRIRALGGEIPRLKTIPIIAMTANAMKSDLDACIASGMSGFVSKPIDKATLLGELTKVLPAETRRSKS